MAPAVEPARGVLAGNAHAGSALAARRDEGASWTYVTEEQRSGPGWIGGPTAAEFLTGGTRLRPHGLCVRQRPEIHRSDQP